MTEGTSVRKDNNRDSPPVRTGGKKKKERSRRTCVSSYCGRAFSIAFTSSATAVNANSNWSCRETKKGEKTGDREREKCWNTHVGTKLWTAECCQRGPWQDDESGVPAETTWSISFGWLTKSHKIPLLIPPWFQFDLLHNKVGNSFFMGLAVVVGASHI